nr:hypothetical protein [Kofleriaceae bacterium]
TLMGTINYAREAYYVAFASSWVSGASGGTYTMPVPTVTADLIATDITEQFESARIFIERDVAANGVVTRDIDLTTAPMLELSSQPGDTVDHTYTSLNTGTTDMGWFDAVAPYQYVALPVALRRSSDVYRISTLSRDGLQGEVDLDEWVDLPRALEVPANSLEVPTLSNMTLAWNWRPEFKDLRVSLRFGDPGGGSLDFLHLSASPQWAAEFTSVDIEGLLQVADIDAGKPLDGADVSASIRNFEWDAGEPPVGSRLVRFTNGVTLGTANRQRPAQPVSATRGRWPRTGWCLRGNRM